MLGLQVYLLLFVIVIYCIGKNLQGEDPDGALGLPCVLIHDDYYY